ncbi:serine-alanine-and proline-rich protein [Trypanosoma cruzi]|nr:serine-alanine-and proline-rich protein [Trypanosoma cruzi]
MMCRVFCVVLVLTLLCCCSCVFAAKEEEEQQPQVTQVNAVCAGDGNVARWQLPGNSLWYNCTDAASGAGKMICGMGVGNCAPEDVKKRIEDGVKDGVFTINVTSPTPDILERWWKRNVEPKAVTAAIVPAKPPAARTPGPQEEEISRDTSPTPDSVSPTAVVEVAAGVPSPAEVPSDSGEIGLAKPLEADTPGPQEDKRRLLVTPPKKIQNLFLLSLRIPRMYLLLLHLQLQAALVLTLLLALRSRRILLLQPRKRRIPLPLMIFKALHVLLLLHPNPHQIRSTQKAAATPPMNLQWSCRKRLLLRHRLSCPRPARTGVQREAPKRTPPPTPPTLLPAKEILRRQACRLPFPLRPQRTHWRTVWELMPASMTPICMPCHRLFWLRSPTGHWAEEVNAGYKCQHSTTWICELLLFYCVIINRK